MELYYIRYAKSITIANSLSAESRSLSFPYCLNSLKKDKRRGDVEKDSIQAWLYCESDDSNVILWSNGHSL